MASSTQTSLQQGVCPVCQKACGHHSPRQAVMAHLRRTQDKQHADWREQHWQKTFNRGAYKHTVEKQMQAVIDQWGVEKSLDYLHTLTQSQ